jgi:excisionase family DNA binding protein
MRIEIEVSDDTIDAIATAITEKLRASPWRAQTESDDLTVAEAAEYLRCSKQRIYDMTSARRLPYYKFGRRVLLRRADIDGWLDRERIGPTSTAPGRW